MINLNELARALPTAWHSVAIGRVGGANIKVLRMDSSGYPSEMHDDAEALIVLEGQLNLQLADETVSVGAGHAFIVPAGQPHAVAHGSRGTLLIVDA